MQKETIVIVIDNFKKGGAETLLTGILPDINKRFCIVIVTLSEECDFAEKDLTYYRRYCLGFKNKLLIFSCILKLKEIIKKHCPVIIHSHLFYSSLISRLAAPKGTPVVYSLHGEMSKNAFVNSKLLLMLERKTVRHNQIPIAVSNVVLEDYKRIVPNIDKSYVLKNYISSSFINHKQRKITNLNQLKLVAVGNIKRAKNYSFLLKAFACLKELDVTLDIYGYGNDKELKIIQNEIDKNELPVSLKGRADNVHEILPKYDLYVSSSIHEGFGLSVIEAMAIGLPLLLSNLPVFQEITFGNALFFEITDPLSLVRLIIEIIEKKHDLDYLSNTGLAISRKYSKEIYLEKLFDIYSSVLIKPFSDFQNLHCKTSANTQ